MFDSYVSQHNPGFLTCGWTRYQLHQIRLDLNIVLTHMENLSASDRYNVTVAHHNLLPNSCTRLESPNAWKVYINRTGSSNMYRSTVED